jgi:hypothetical protein
LTNVLDRVYPIKKIELHPALAGGKGRNINGFSQNEHQFLAKAIKGMQI